MRAMDRMFPRMPAMAGLGCRRLSVASQQTCRDAAGRVRADWPRRG